MSEIIKNRSELLFCYDVTDANPNGDPLDANKPRIDEETNINFVTDVRLKRTIRDYLFEYFLYSSWHSSLKSCMVCLSSWRFFISRVMIVMYSIVIMYFIEPPFTSWRLYYLQIDTE